jgi:hypothetical protein
LIIQGLNTDIDKSVANAPVTTFPKDKVEGRLMFEVHYYDPYQYTLMTSQQDWGASEPIQPQYYYGDYTKAGEPKRNAGYNAWAGSVDSKLGSIVHPQEQFAKMKTNYVDKGYPVIVGEFGANVRSPELNGSDLNLHKQGRVQWHKDVVSAAKQYGLTPILWDMGNESDSGYDNMAYIRRQSSPVGKVLETDVINAMRSVYNLGNYNNTGVTHVEDFINGGNNEPASSSSEVASSSSEPTTTLIAGLNTTVQFTRNGNMLYSNKPIRLFDATGNLIRSTQKKSGRLELSLAGLHKGVYLAKSANKTLVVGVR